MAEIQLHPDIANLADSNPARFSIYQELLQGMKTANEVEMPDYSLPPYSVDTGQKWVDPEGKEVTLYQPDESVISAKMTEISEIQMKNSAYLFAKLISTGGGGSGGGDVDLTKLVQKDGDTMLGLLGALRGFEAGVADKKIFDVTINPAEDKIAHVYGSLIVDDELQILGHLNLSNDGVYFGNHQSIWYDNNTLHFDAPNYQFDGDINVDGSITIGDVTINTTGISWGTNDFYHSGNCNNSTTDWSMKDAHVYGDLIVDGDAEYSGRLKALKGFDLGENDEKWLYSVYDTTSGEGKAKLNTDLDIVNGHGIKFDDEYILKVRGGSTNIVSLSAPGKVLNLGDYGGSDSSPLATQYISLQADIKNDRSTYTMVSSNGDGNFPNSFQAGCANSGATVIRTYHLSADDCGIVAPKMLAFGDESGPHVYSDGVYNSLNLSLPFSYTENSALISVSHLVSVSIGESQYPWRDFSRPYDASIILDTDSEYFVFNQPILSKTFAIFNSKYHTKLEENALFLNTNTFIEGVNTGMRFTGNAFFNQDLSSSRFASGFAGYGWGIVKHQASGSYLATFDELTVRKRMRIYELEVQKQNVTNGSWWVTDSCSGDTVEEYQWQS